MKSRSLRYSLLALLCAVVVTACQQTKAPAPDTRSADATSKASAAIAQRTSLKIATFNVENLGAAKLKKKDVVAVLVGIVRKYDIVAVQEIADATLKTPERFLAEIDADPTLDRYAVLASPRTGQQPADRTSQEQYAYYYNTRTVRVVDEGGLFPDAAENLFRREPMAAQFATADGRLSVVLVTIHTDPDVAPKEIAGLAKARQWATQRFEGETGVILLGDFNAGVAYTKLAEIARIRRDDLPFSWIVPDDADTTLAAKPQAHDRIILCGDLARCFSGQWAVDRCFDDGRVSDHWPVWVELTSPAVVGAAMSN